MNKVRLLRQLTLDEILEPGRFAQHDEILEILTASIKSQLSVDIIAFTLMCNFFQVLILLGRSNWGQLAGGVGGGGCGGVWGGGTLPHTTLPTNAVCRPGGHCTNGRIGGSHVESCLNDANLIDC